MSPNYLTNSDVENYGSELVDFAQRAAAHALAPELQRIEQDNAAMRARLAKESRARLDVAVEQAVPNFREIDRDPRFHQFLTTVDPLNGVVRQHLLNDAIAAGDTYRVVAFFRGFLQSLRNAADLPNITINPHHQRIRDKPGARPTGTKMYDRKEIARLYDQHRRGAYVGREAVWQQIEADIFAAGREGRVVGATDWEGK